MHVMILIGEMLHDNMFSTGAIRCVVEAANVLSKRYRVTLIGTSSEGDSDRQLNANARLVLTKGTREDVLNVMSAVQKGEAVDVLIATVDHCLHSAVSFVEDYSEVKFVFWNHLCPVDYEVLDGLQHARDHLQLILTPTANESARIAEHLAPSSIPIHVVTNGISPPTVEQTTTTTGNSNVLFVGRRTKAKGYDVWIEACELLALQRQDIQFRAVGQPSRDTPTERASVVESALIASGRLTVSDYLTPRKLWQTMHKTQVLVLPSRQECMPVSIIEAMHLGIPIIASDIPNLREMAEGIEAFELVNSRSPRMLFKAVEARLNDTNVELLNGMKQYAASRFTADNMADDIDLAISGLGASNTPG